jgi:DNA polymerase-3 subunit alpha
MLIDIRTDYSLLNSLIKIEDLIELAQKKKWQFLGIADFDAGGLLDFYLSCKEANIKPILGLRFYITDNLENTTDSEIILYAQNYDGYKTLIKLYSDCAINNYKNNQTNLLVSQLENINNLICVLPIGNSPNELCTKQGVDILGKLKVFFENKIFFGLKNRNCAIDDIFLRKAEKANVPYIFLSNAKYLETSDFAAFKTLRAINARTTIDRLFETVWVDESIELAEKQLINYKHDKYLNRFLSLIDINIPTPGLKVPKFPIPEGYNNSYDYLVYLCRQGFLIKKDSFPNLEIVSERMKIELDVMNRCQLADYFLLVYDICQYCDENDIPRGISRGSAGSSLVAYLLDISRINPLEYDLLFERFLNEDRTKPIDFNGETYLTDAPDIDLDIGQLQRQQVINWLREKFGHVAKIATYTTLSSKACVKDVCRAFGKTEKEATWASSHVEVLYGKSDSISTTYDKSEKFREWVASNEELYKIALKLEGIKKNSSIHAAGIIVSNELITNRAPIFLANHSENQDFKKDECIAYSLDFAAKAGLIKMDLLGIRTLNVLQNTINLIKV